MRKRCNNAQILINHTIIINLTVTNLSIAFESLNSYFSIVFDPDNSALSAKKYHECPKQLVRTCQQSYQWLRSQADYLPLRCGFRSVQTSALRIISFDVAVLPSNPLTKLPICYGSGKFYSL